MNIVCVGSGYVGSVTAASFSTVGYKTTVIDVDPHKVESINAGKSPIYEPGLDSSLQENVKNGLSATSSYQPVSDADFVFICVGTPSTDQGTADLTYVKAAAREIGRNLNPDRFTAVVNKSTVPVGTAELVSRIIEQTSGLKVGLHFAVVSNPEFLREGYALEDVFFPDRVVVGADHAQARAMMRELYRIIVERTPYSELFKWFAFPYNAGKIRAVYYETDTKSAEMIKYASNSFLAIKISYINEIARLCEALGANALEVAKGMGLDARIGHRFLEVSSGWSGSCFPKDTAELLATSRQYGRELGTLKAAMISNEAMHHYCVEKIQRHLKALNGKTVGILGLTFKPNTDDARQTQASVIMKGLLELGADIMVHDPKGMETFRQLHPDLAVQYCRKAEDAAKEADALVLLTHWDEYSLLDWGKIFQLMRHPYVLDTRNVLRMHNLAKYGFHYEGLGIT